MLKGNPERRWVAMAVWTCGKCGYEKKGRCKPKKCPACGASDPFEKK